MPDQIPLFPAPDLPADLPPAVAEILRAARAVASGGARVVRGTWGVGVGIKRRWVLTDDCCCALAALLVVRQAECASRDRSPVHAVARELGITGAQVRSFVSGYDEGADDGSPWSGYGRRVAQELGLSPREH